MWILVNFNVNKCCNVYFEMMDWFGFELYVIKIEGEGWVFEEIGCQGVLCFLEIGGFLINMVLCSNDCLVIGFLLVCYEKGYWVG